jgi:hypothetical protein
MDVIAVDYGKALFTRVVRDRIREEDLPKPLNGYSFHHPPLLLDGELPVFIIFEGYGELLLLQR